MGNEQVEQYDNMNSIGTFLICYLDIIKILK